ncbi:MAG: inositol monophosphatase [Chitinispirillaceae bacterium]|nr:inositol monophosphatase [Chitinispirillaceae bacterium]
MKSVLSLAKETAKRAGELVASLLGKTAIERKGSSYDLITDADRKAEELITAFLTREMPGCEILGEEAHREGKLTADRLWIIDPLDGTTNFAHAIPHFGISVAYAEKGVLISGAVYDPMRDELFSAAAGHGARCNGASVRVSKSRDLSQSLIAIGFYYDRSMTMKKTLQALYRLYQEDIRCMRRMGAASLDLAWLACGRFDGYFEYTLSPWDFAAGLLVVLEAGGRASGNDGSPAGLSSGGLICSNGLIHDKLLACVLNPGAIP